MIPKNRRFSFILVLMMCLTLCLTALCEGDTEEVSITIFDENGEVKPQYALYISLQEDANKAKYRQ